MRGATERPGSPEPPAWSRIVAEARNAFAGAGRFPLRAYSELMPPPYVGIKPYDPEIASACATFGVSDPTALDVSEYEQAHELEPGLDRIADHIVGELGKLVGGRPHALSRTLLADNPAWPADLAAAAAAGLLADEPLALALPLALSRTQDDKGNDRWTLFGASHDGPAAPIWRSLDDAGQLHRLVGWAVGAPAEAVRVLADADEVPAFLRPHLLGDGSLASVRALVAFRPFAHLPEPVRRAYLTRKLTLFPCPASLVFFEHPRYRELAKTLPRAMQIPLLHLFPRIEESCAIRVPQSGWLDEGDRAQAAGHGHRVVDRVARTHRWQRVARDADVAGDGRYSDKVTAALFATDPDVVGLYDKPMARNAQVWTEDYQLLLDGTRAGRADIERAARAIGRGGRFGYRFHYPPMRAGTRELFWHLPLCARRGPAGGAAERFAGGAPLGYVTAEADGPPPIALAPQLLARPAHRAAAALFPHEPGHRRFTTTHNVRKLLEIREYLGAPLAPSLARALVHTRKAAGLDAWLAELPAMASDAAAAAKLVASLRAAIGPEEDLGPTLTLGGAGSRGFEESIWRTIASLAEGDFRQKENADGIAVNRGRTGGPAARAAGLVVAERRDLERLGDHLHERHRALIAKHGMEGRAEVVDQVFTWTTDFAYPWMEGWARNQHGAGQERNIVVMIPGRDRGSAVLMGDHYDTAYMEDVYDADRGGDKLRAPAAGADDNHSATTALLTAADVLLPLARAGKLERDVWLVHLTGEEFPADSLGARALVEAAVERRLVFTTEAGDRRDVSHVRIVGAFILDMIGHNTERDRDVFQIAPGEGAGSARLALRAHRANERWNRAAAAWNRAPDRHGRGRAQRMPDGSRPPPPFAHLALTGEVRLEWEPRSTLYNTDGQIFSDVGIPVVLFMENYDISRTGYHDTHDTMANIDLDYVAALTAIAIEAVADTACAPSS
jgi:peptidase M28-like protein